MPSFLVGSAQHSTAGANSSRVVTKIRWVIEALNSRIKKWKYFANVLLKMNEFKKQILKRNMQLDPWVLKFPELSEEYIQRLTFGVYQLKQARSYTGEHIDQNGNYMFEMFKEETNVNSQEYVFCN